MTSRYKTPLATGSVIAAGLLATTASAELVDVTYGTNWVAQAEHGGFYQSAADGTYAECGLNVTILLGGPQVNNQALLLAGRIDFYMGGTLDAFFGVAERLPLVNVMASFQKDPQVIISHPGRVSSFEDLTGLQVGGLGGAVADHGKGAPGMLGDGVRQFLKVAVIGLAPVV